RRRGSPAPRPEARRRASTGRAAGREGEPPLLDRATEAHDQAYTRGLSSARVPGATVDQASACPDGWGEGRDGDRKRERRHRAEHSRILANAPMSDSTMRRVPAILLLTGASGCGKTTVVRALREADPDGIYLHLDSIGVPDPTSMVRAYGS